MLQKFKVGNPCCGVGTYRDKQRGEAWVYIYDRKNVIKTKYLAHFLAF